MSKTIMTRTIEECLVPFSGDWCIEDVDPKDTLDLESKEEALQELAEIHEQMKALQMTLHAEGQRSLLVILQAMDAGGKDGTIRHVFGALNPHWARVTDFKAPTAEELAHDYLWRIHNALPRRGTIGIHNRSHYEDVLIARVHSLAKPSVIARRYNQINAFEKHLSQNGVTILKFHLRISKREQRKRFEARLEEPDKRWKFSLGDLKERKSWDDYMKAYEKALCKCSTKHAPWYTIPADRKWARNVIIARIVLDTLQAMNPQIPNVDIIRR